MDVFVGPPGNGALAGALLLRENEVREVEQALTAPRCVCTCGRVFSAESWDQLELMYTKLTMTDEGDPAVMNVEIRACSFCGRDLACLEIK